MPSNGKCGLRTWSPSEPGNEHPHQGSDKLPGAHESDALRAQWEGMARSGGLFETITERQRECRDIPDITKAMVFFEGVLKTKHDLATIESLGLGQEQFKAATEGFDAMVQGTHDAAKRFAAAMLVKATQRRLTAEHRDQPDAPSHLHKQDRAIEIAMVTYNIRHRNKGWGATRTWIFECLKEFCPEGKGLITDMLEGIKLDAEGPPIFADTTPHAQEAAIHEHDPMNMRR